MVYSVKDETKSNKQSLQTTTIDTIEFFCGGESPLYVYRPVISVTPSSEIGRLKERASHKTSDGDDNPSDVQAQYWATSDVGITVDISTFSHFKLWFPFYE